MNQTNNALIHHFAAIVTAMFAVALMAAPAMSGEYGALEGVKSVKTVFDVSQGVVRKN